MKENTIPRFWHSNASAKSSRGSFWTDGSDLYSNQKKIGTTSELGEKILYNYTKPGGTFISALTSRHVNLARFYADQLISTKEN